MSSLEGHERYMMLLDQIGLKRIIMPNSIDEKGHRILMDIHLKQVEHSRITGHTRFSKLNVREVGINKIQAYKMCIDCKETDT